MPTDTRTNGTCHGVGEFYLAMGALAFTLGLMVVVNPYIRPLGDHTRALDLLPIVLLPFLLHQVLYARGGIMDTVIGAVLIFTVELPWIVSDWRSLGFFAPVYSTRWLVLLPYAVELVAVTRETRGRVMFCRGILVGGAVNSVVLWLQSIGLTGRLVSLGLAYPNPPILFAVHAFRYSGLHGHPNAAAAVVSLCIPAALSLMTEFKYNWKVLCVGISICVPAALLTLSRSAFLVSGIVILLWFMRSGKRHLALGLLATPVVSLLFTLVASPMLNQRWTLNQGTENNASFRWETTKESLSLLVKSPFGFGSNLHDIEFSGTATHNGFTALALYGGIFIAFLVAALMLRPALYVFRDPKIENWFALHIFGLCLFEEHFSNPTFIALALWIACTTLRNLTAPPKPARRRTPGRVGQPYMGGPEVVTGSMSRRYLTFKHAQSIQRFSIDSA